MQDKEVDEPVVPLILKKINLPLKYSSKRNKLTEFLLKIDVYLNINSRAFNSKLEKVLYTILYLKGNAFRQFVYPMQDYLTNGP